MKKSKKKNIKIIKKELNKPKNKFLIILKNFNKRD